MRLYSRTLPVEGPVELSVMLQDEAFAQEVEVVEVQDHELCLHYRNGNYHQVLTPGRYAFWKGAVEHRFEHQDLNDLAGAQQLSLGLLQRVAVRRHVQVFSVAKYEKGLLLVDGELRDELGPGQYRYWRNGQEVNILKADLRASSLELGGQELLTRDKATVRINFNVQYQITDIHKALLETRDAQAQLYLRLQLALREFVGTHTLDELLASKDQLAQAVQAYVDESAAEMGLRLINAGIRDVILPRDMKEIMNQVLIAEKTAQANTILRREDTAATRALLNTAKLMEDNPMLLRLKEMEYVAQIAENVNSISLSGGSQVLEQLRQLFGTDRQTN